MNLFVLMFHVPVNNFSVMSGRFPVFLGWTSTKQRIKWLAQGQNTVPDMSLKLMIIWLRAIFMKYEMLINIFYPSRAVVHI